MALLADLRVRAEFINALRQFYETLNLLEHRPEVPGDCFRDAKLLGFINKVAANLYRDPTLNLLGVAEQVKCLINAHRSPPAASRSVTWHSVWSPWRKGTMRI